MSQPSEAMTEQRMSIIYVGGIVALCGLGVGGLVMIEWLRPEGWNTALTGQFLTILTPTIAILASLLQSVRNGSKLDHLHDCTHRVEEAVKGQTTSQEAVNENQRVVNEAQRTLNESRKDKP